MNYATRLYRFILDCWQRMRLMHLWYTGRNLYPRTWPCRCALCGLGIVSAADDLLLHGPGNCVPKWGQA